MRRQNRYLKPASWLFLAGALTPAFIPLSTDAQEALKAERTRAEQWAEDTAKIAGAATFCKLDQEEIENYINRAHAKIAANAADEVDLVIARVHFSNIYSRASSIEPDEGCEAFTIYFASADEILQ